MTQQHRLLVVWIAALLVVGAVSLGAKVDDDSKAGGDKGGQTTGGGSGHAGGGVPGSDTTGPGGSTSPTSDGGGAPTTLQPSASAPPAVDAPAPGSYATAVSGSMTFNGTETFDAPPEGEFLVEAADAGDQRVSIPIGPGLLSTVLAYRADRIDMVETDMVLGPAKSFIPPEPVVHVPGAPQPGQSWQWTMTSTDGATNGTYSTTASGPAVVEVGGVKIPVVVLETVVEFDPRSDLLGRIQMTTWFSLELRLPMQNHVVIDVNYGGGVIALQSDVTSTLTSLSPS